MASGSIRDVASLRIHVFHPFDRHQAITGAVQMNRRVLLSILAGFTVTAFSDSFSGAWADAPDESLKVVIIRHGEKPDDGDNLSCQGFNRSVQLPKVLNAKFGIPSHTYVPSLELGKSTSHSRMFQTVTPTAVKFNLKINSEFGEKDTSNAAKDVMTKKNTVLLVWEHSAIPDLAKALGVDNPPAWKGSDFDSIWIITYPKGKATLNLDKEGITPSAECPF
jgi:hypothetical protein